MAARALVTGATAGIGHSFAKALAARGDRVVLVARDGARLQAVADELGNAEVLVADLTQPDDLARVAAVAGDVDLVVNNAGSSLNAWFGTTDIADEDHQLDLLVRAPMHLMDAALKGRATGIINVASIAAYLPRGAYSAHKAWLVNLSRWAHAHYRGRVNVMVLCPGFVHTEFHQRMGFDKKKVAAWMWLDADRVVADALSDFDKHRAVSVPSKRYKLVAFAAKYVPLSLLAKIGRKGRD